MPPKKKIEKEFLLYKGKPLLRCGDEIYYGNREDKYVVLFRIAESQEIMGMPVSSKVIIELKTNQGERSKLIKQAQRDGLYKALDIGCFWLEDALENG